MARYFSDDYITEVMEKNDIVSVISSYVNLKRSGSTMKGLCPFHREKTPSFSVSPDKQLFHCFGCGKGGTVINFTMYMNNLDFVEAVTMLAEKSGMDLPDEQDSKSNNGEIRQLIYKINAEAGRFYYDCLMKDENCPAREYVKKRGLTKSTVNHFGIGYAPSGNAVLKHLRDSGYTDEQILASGIVGKSENGDIYDRFRNRFMIPIIDQRKNIIGFGGRVLDDSKPKYLNSPETVAFNKSYNLFGLNFAKNSKEDYFVLVEGYMDVISLHQYGITSAVATLGTALTPEQARIMKHKKEKVVIAYDSDEAGQKATERAIGILNDEELNVKVITVPGDKDPDDYIKRNGAGAFHALIDKAPDNIKYKEMKLLEKLDLENDAKEYLHIMEAEIAKLKNDDDRDLYISRLATKLNMKPDNIKNKVDAERERLNNIKKISKNFPDFKLTEPKSTIGEKTREEKQFISAQETIINLLCYKDEVVEQILSKFEEDDFEEETNRKLFVILKEIREKGEIPDSLIIISNHPEIRNATAVLIDDKNIDDAKLAVSQVFEIIKKQRIFKLKQKRRNEEISSEEFKREYNRIMESSTKESGSNK